MTVTFDLGPSFELDLDGVKLTQHAKCQDRWSTIMSEQTHTPDKLLYLYH